MSGHRTAPTWALTVALGLTVATDLGAGVGLVVAHEAMLGLAGLPGGPTADALMPALGVTLIAVAALAALAARWTWSGKREGAAIGLVLGAMLVGVGLAQFLSAGLWQGLALDVTRGLFTAGAALACLRGTPSRAA
jgi:hypothetical protein